MEVMQDNAPSVGEALSLAMARAAELRDASPRRVRVRFLTRFGDLPDGLTIQATISPRTIPESEAQLGKGVRHIPFCELDARAGQLSQLVDDAAAEVEAAVAAAPCPAKRPSQIEEDLVTTAYDDLVESGYRSMLEVTGPLAAKSSASLSTAAIGEALVLGALKLAALSAVAGRIELEDLVEMLTSEVREARARLMEAAPAEASLH